MDDHHQYYGRSGPGCGGDLVSGDACHGAAAEPQAQWGDDKGFRAGKPEESGDRRPGTGEKRHGGGARRRCHKSAVHGGERAGGYPSVPAAGADLKGHGGPGYEHSGSGVFGYERGTDHRWAVHGRGGGDPHVHGDRRVSGAGWPWQWSQGQGRPGGGSGLLSEEPEHKRGQPPGDLRYGHDLPGQGRAGSG